MLSLSIHFTQLVSDDNSVCVVAHMILWKRWGVWRHDPLLKHFMHLKDKFQHIDCVNMNGDDTAKTQHLQSTVNETELTR